MTSIKPLTHRRSDFPGDFEFGTSTSSYQIEGNSFGGCGRSHWDDFAATPGNVANGENGAVACDHYHRYEEDFDLLRQAGFDSYRFSTSWARVYPQGRGQVNEAGLDYYDRMVDALLARGLKPYSCLYHWDLPSALADLGGWRNRDIAGWFADYTHTVMARIGDRIHGAATFNEPWCIAWLSHFMGVHAPGLRDIRAATRAMHHVLLAHGRSVEAMRALGHKNVGVVLNFEYAQAADETPQAKAAAHRYDGIYNRWFLGGVFRGEYPRDVLEALGPHMPENWSDDMATISAPVDWLGINYYTRKIIAPDPGSLWPSLGEVEGSLEKTEMGWEVYPDGLHHFITWAHENYSMGLPIHVTENGMAGPEVKQGQSVDDPWRISYLEGHLAAVRRAIADGAPVKSYFIWSLLDNFEWSLGYDKRFGIVHVDFDTLERTPKASFHAIADAIRR